MAGSGEGEGEGEGFAAGESVGDAVKTGGGDAEAARLAAGIAGSTDRAHAKHIAHSRHSAHARATWIGRVP